MKRSKMENRIATTIIRHLQECGVEKSPITIDQMVELSQNILTVIEREGMLPPEIPHLDPLFNHPESVFINEWEKEDETK